jgi:general secretion pathway protein N
MFAPATLLDAVVKRGSEGRLRIAEAQGTLWTGNGQLEVRDVTRGGGVGRRLYWRFQPQSLLRGQLLFEVDVADASKSFPLKISLSGIEISDAELAFPAAVLGLAVPSVALIGPTGDLLVHVIRLSVAGHDLAGNVTVHWQSAGSSLTPVSPLGDYELTMESDSRGVNVSLRTLEGPLRLSGKGSSRREGPFALTVSARVDPQQQAQLTPFLRLIAVERQPGVFELQIAQTTGRAPGEEPVRQ